MSYTYEQFSIDVIKDAQFIEMEDFKLRIFDRINQLIPINCGRWLTRTSFEDNYHSSGMCLYNLPAHRDSDTLKKFKKQDFLYRAIIENLGKAINTEDLVSDEDWFGSDIYIHACKEFGIDRACSIIVPCEYTGVINAFGFYRTGKENRFSKADCQLLETVAHFVSHAIRINLFLNLEKYSGHGLKNCAVFDHLGRIVDSTPMFKSCINSLLNTNFVSLPEEWFTPEKLPAAYSLGSAKFKIQRLNDLYLVCLETKTIFDDFTPKEKLVAELISQGVPSKVIAQKLNISVNTVSDHSKNISKKCGGFGQGVTGRAKLSSFLAGELKK